MNSLTKSLFLVSLLLATQTTVAQEDAIATADKAATATVDAKQAAALQKQLDAQAASGAKANATLVDLQRALNEQRKLIEAQKKQIEEQQAQIQASSELLTNMQSQIDQLKQEEQRKLSESEIAMRQKMAELESEVSKIPDDPSTLLADENFPGAVRVPGTTAAYKIGGFVKASLVRNFNPLLTQDRFIVGSIPVTPNDEEALAAELSMTANQSRVNFDYRQQSDLGDFRAFIEGDFGGDGDTFRLRHAFGQFRDLLAGKTWSAFYDAQAAPEEVDFEGINGRVIVRQTQVRYFPQIGKNWRWMISLEDPNPQVTGGSGVSNYPDLVTSIRRDWFSRWHVKSALLLRQIGAVNNNGVDQNGQSCDPGVADPECIAIANPGDKQSVFGWAVTASGNVQVPWWNENDNFLFQLNYGRGIGRYLNDLASVTSLGIEGGQDAIIDPATGQMFALPAFGGYVAFQHWWAAKVRSTFLFSLVNVDNLDFQSAVAYHQTQRASANLIWSPISNVDLGAEFLWGKRINKAPDNFPGANGAQQGTATQLQLEAVYRF